MLSRWRGVGAERERDRERGKDALFCLADVFVWGGVFFFILDFIHFINPFREICLRYSA